MLESVPALVHSVRMKLRAATAALITVFALGPVAAGTGSALGPQPSAGCGDLGDTDPVNDGFPNRMSSLVGADMRTGGHECFERVVLELQGSGELPGYQVRYEPDPILDSPRGEPVDIAGEATLVLSVGVWMTDIEGNGYQGPTEIVPTNVVNIRELELIENFEGQSAWAIGLDQQRGFTVSTLSDPVRIVIDIELAPAELRHRRPRAGGPTTTVARGADDIRRPAASSRRPADARRCISRR